MMEKKLVQTDIYESYATIWLDRPQKQNALNHEMIAGFLATWKEMQLRKDIRLIIIRGKGDAFCSGADLIWMNAALKLSHEENIKECNLLAQCFYEIYNSSKITICFAHGASMGGGNGFIAASDLAFADEQTVFSFSEVLWGLIPATIAPYVIAKTGKARALEYMLTGKKIYATEARASGLITDLIPFGEADSYIERLVNQILKGAPMAQTSLKTLFREMVPTIDASVISKTAAALAQTRVGLEAQEGMNAFMEKRIPVWNSLKI